MTSSASAKWSNGSRMPNRKFVVWGSSGHARVLNALLTNVGDRIVALCDNDPAARSVVNGAPLILGSHGLAAFLMDWSPHSLCGAVAIGGGRGSERRAILDLFDHLGIAAPSLRHPDASVCGDVSIGAGSQVLAHATIAAGVDIGRACIINHGAVVDHECRLADGVHIAPGAVLTGVVDVGRDAFVGARAVVLPRLTLGEGCIIGAGAVVTKHVAAGDVVVGNPAKSFEKVTPK